jgi:hypothetical protein
MRRALKAKLIDEGLTEQSSANNEDLCFELNKVYKKIPVNALIKKNGN